MFKPVKKWTQIWYGCRNFIVSNNSMSGNTINVLNWPVPLLNVKAYNRCFYCLIASIDPTDKKFCTTYTYLLIEKKCKHLIDVKKAKCLISRFDDMNYFNYLNIFLSPFRSSYDTWVGQIFFILSTLYFISLL